MDDDEHEPLHNSSRHQHYSRRTDSQHHTTIDINNDNNAQQWPDEARTFVSETTNMSHFSQENLARFPKDRLSRIKCDPQFVSTIVITSLAYSTPVLFILIPFLRSQSFVCQADDPLNNPEGSLRGGLASNCRATMQSNLVTIVIKLLTLPFASYWIFWQRARCIYPRTHWPRVLSLGLLAMTTAIYWLFYAVIIIQKEGTPENGVTFAGHAVDVLMYIHLIAIIVIEIRVNSPNGACMFLCEVIRSTDGEHKFYNFTQMTIQETANHILQKYYRDFPVNNPAALLVGTASQKRREAKSMNDSTTHNNTQQNMKNNKDFKIYNVDGKGSNTDDNNVVEQSKQVIAAATSKRREAAHAANERFYDQLEWERHLRKRRCRLEMSAEDAFGHCEKHDGHMSRKAMRRAHGYEKGDRFPPNIMDANEAATVLFPSIARPLQKFLRTTRQHLHYSLSSTTQHLALSLKHGLSYRSFLKRYFNPRPQLAFPHANAHDSSEVHGGDNVEWTISSEASLTSNITENTVFLLGTQDFSLLIQCYPHPSIQLQETFPDTKSRFTLRVNTTSV